MVTIEELEELTGDPEFLKGKNGDKKRNQLSRQPPRKNQVSKRKHDEELTASQPEDLEESDSGSDDSSDPSLDEDGESVESSNGDNDSVGTDEDDDSHDKNYGVEEGSETANSKQLQDKANELQVKQPSSMTGEPCTFDLRNLSAFNTHQNDTSKLYLPRSNKTLVNELLTIGGTDGQQSQKTCLMPMLVNEEYLLSKATDACAQLIDALWQLPMEKSSDAGAIAVLPSFDAIKLPRALVRYPSPTFSISSRSFSCLPFSFSCFDSLHQHQHRKPSGKNLPKPREYL
jgi:hypothetical protein